MITDLANRLYSYISLYDWPHSYKELFDKFRPNEIDFVAALVLLRFEGKIVRHEGFYEGV